MNKNILYTNSPKYRCLEYLRCNSSDLYLNYCGKEQCEPNHQFGPAQRHEYVLHYIINGKGNFTFNNHTHQLSTGDCFLIIPNETTIYTASADNPWSYVWVGFNGAKAKSCLRYAGLSEEKRINHFSDGSQIVQCIDNILNAHHLTYAHDLIRQSNLMLLFANMIEQNQSSEVTNFNFRSPQHIYVEYTVHYIENNYQKDIKISAIASEIGINRSYLTSHFTKIMGISPQEFLLNLRMNHAALLLRTTHISINQIAEQIGYTNPLTFSKIFKSYFGESPKFYRLNKEKLILSDTKEKSNKNT
ncbi:AraC family transcriptional regulator [Clostridiales bacterium COT073_COT-073]|nr:AraC family transcriptional regulator [Clostridiales bacterium COT073_COT-073]